jgi:tripartite-type tricarboxylate transporter receptor subunit TctC
MSRARFLFSLIFFALSAATSPGASANEWPQRPLRLVVPFSPGSSSDVIARIVAAKMSERLGQQIIIDNRVGGSTIIGTDYVAKSQPDGYTLGLANTTTHAASVALNSRLPFNPTKDFTPIGMIGSSPFILVAPPSLQASSLKEFVDLAKKTPGQLNYASAGTGTLAHLAGELFKFKAGIDVSHVPYRGTAQSTMDLMQGRIDLSISTVPPTLSYIRQGQLRALAVMAEARSAMLPDLATVAEAGIPGCEAGLWTALVLPAGVPADIVDRLNRIMNDVVNSADVQQALKAQGVDPEPGSPSAVTAIIAADIIKWTGVVTAAKIGGSK